MADQRREPDATGPAQAAQQGDRGLAEKGEKVGAIPPHLVRSPSDTLDHGGEGPGLGALQLLLRIACGNPFQQPRMGGAGAGDLHHQPVLAQLFDGVVQHPGGCGVEALDGAELDPYRARIADLEVRQAGVEFGHGRDAPCAARCDNDPVAFLFGGKPAGCGRHGAGPAPRCLNDRRRQYHISRPVESYRRWSDCAYSGAAG